MAKGIKRISDVHTNVVDKAAEMSKKSKIYSTERINKMLDDLNHGGSPDMDPFWHGQTSYRDSGIIFQYTDKELEELEKCANDPIYFIENYCTFKNDKGRTLVKLRDYQKDTIHLYGDEEWDPVSETVIPKNRRVILMWSRQCAKTTTTAAYFAHKLIFNHDKTAMVVANKERTGKEILGKIKEVLEDLPYFMKPGIINLSDKKIKLENGCVLSTVAASKSPATGDSINLLYIDEAALIPANIIDEYWASVYPTLSSFRGSQIIMSSTPRGKGNLFYRIYDGAVTGKMKGWKYKRVDWWQVPEHDEEWLNQQKQDLGEELFKREVELSFESSDSRLITPSTVRLQERIKQKFNSIDFYSVPQEISNKIIWSPDFDPSKMTYEQLKHKRFLLVVDTAQGIEAGAIGKTDSDYNVINIFEIEPMSPNKIEKNRDNKPISTKDVIQYKQVGIYMDNYNDEAQCAEAAKYITFQIFKCGYQDIDNVKILIEINFNGNNWITKFKNHPSYYDSIILKTVRGIQKPGQPIQQMKLQYGFRTTTGSHGKNYYCELGAKMMHRRQIIVRQYDDNINISTLGQLSQFGKTSKGNYAGSCCHDDISVTSLFVCIAQESRQFIIWINDWLETTIPTKKILMIQKMLQIYVEQDVQMSDEMFHAFYKAASANFGKLTYEQKGYSSIINGSNNTYSNTYTNIYGKNY